MEMEFAAIVLASIFAGMFGAMLGLGGGIILIPILTLVFHQDIKVAVATSLVAVIATSTGGAISYVKNNRVNIRLGMTLEVATSLGALIAGFTIAFINAKYLTVIFITVLSYTAIHMLITTIKKKERKAESEELTELEELKNENEADYEVKNIPAGMGLSLFAGLLSGYLGIGGGVVTVPTLRLFMGVPMKTAVATSNFMIGVTAATGALIYFAKGEIVADITAAVMTGVLIGANIGARICHKLSGATLNYIFIIVLLFTTGKMIYETFIR